MTADQLEEELYGQIEDVIAEAEAELGRDLTDEERDSVVEEFLAELDAPDEPAAPDETTDLNPEE